METNLKQAIVAAFLGSDQPSTRDLVQGESLEAAMVRNYLACRQWQELDAEALRNYDSRADLAAMPAFLSNAGFKYYLPSLLLFVLARGNDAGGTLDSLVSKLGSRTDVAAYSHEQRLAIQSFLRRLAELNEADPLFVSELHMALDHWREC